MMAATQFSIDDAFVLEGEEEEEGGGGVSDGESEGWKSVVIGGGGGGGGRDKDAAAAAAAGGGGEMTFGTLSFTKPQSLPSAAAAGAGAGSPDHSNMKYQNLENEDVLGSSVNSTFNNFFKISDPATLSYCSSQWSFSTLSSFTQLSGHCCGWSSHPLVKKNKKVVLASFLLLITGLALIFAGIVIQLNPEAGVSSAIFFVPGFLLFIPGVYHVIYITCAVRGRRGFRFFYLPYFEK